MKKRIWIACLFLFLGIAAGVLGNRWQQEKQLRTWTAAVPAAVSASERPESSSLTLHALSAVLMDGDSGRVLYGKDETAFRPMASTTKIMTCILALENGEFTDVCTISKEAAAQPKVHLGAPAGSEFYLKDLLYSLMLESHNDTAVAIAQQVGGSVENFAKMMNQKARDIGCENTYFITPNGLDATITAPDGTEYTHGTTAADLAKIMRYCILESPKKEEFLKITRTGNYGFSDRKGRLNYQCTNHNALLTMMDGALTGKTGFTGGAGYSYVAALEDQGRTYVIALLGSGWPPHKTYKWADVRTLFGYGTKEYHYRDVFREPKLPSLPVEEGVEMEKDGKKWTFGEVSVNLTMNLQKEQKHLLLLLQDQEQITVKNQLKDKLKAPVVAGDLAGHVIYELDGTVIKTYPVYAGKSVKRRDLEVCMEQIWNCFLLPQSEISVAK